MALPKINIKKTISLMLAVSVVALAGCSQVPNSSNITPSNDVYSSSQPNESLPTDPENSIPYTMNDKFRNSQLDFSVKMFKTAAASDKGKNLLVSPLSANIALSMTANGASGNTLNEMQSVLNNEISINDSNNEFKNYLSYLSSTKELNYANSIWLKNDFSVNKEFLDINKNYFSSDVFSEPFDAATIKKINDWASEKTNGMIDNAIDDMSPAAIMYLINALSFDAKWENPYENPKDISRQIFTSYSKKEKTIEMMCSDEYEYIETKDATGFAKKYDGGKYSFIAVLPNQDVDIYAYVSSLSKENINEIITKKSNVEVKTFLPKFEYDYDAVLNSTLKAIGINDAFNSNADFSNMVESKKNMGIFISEVLQKTHISVDTEGTKAAAITSVEMSKSAMPLDDPKTVKLDRPFVYMIVDNQNNMPVFIGTVVEL